MSEIIKYRKKIDEIDNELMRLLKERFYQTNIVMDIKKESGLNKLDKDREDIILDKAKLYGDEVYDIYQYILKVSKEGVKTK